MSFTLRHPSRVSDKYPFATLDILNILSQRIVFLIKFIFLQAALTIFGVVGGPMLGLYTLGMFLPSCNQKGAIAGFVLSLMFSLWIGFGQPKPPIPQLDVSTDGCGFNNTIMYLGSNEKSLIYANLHYTQWVTI